MGGSSPVADYKMPERTRSFIAMEDEGNKRHSMPAISAESILASGTLEEMFGSVLDKQPAPYLPGERSPRLPFFSPPPLTASQRKTSPLLPKRRADWWSGES